MPHPSRMHTASPSQVSVPGSNIAGKALISLMEATTRIELV
jgi:hypothetical protein